MHYQTKEQCSCRVLQKIKDFIAALADRVEYLYKFDMMAKLNSTSFGMDYYVS